MKWILDKEAWLCFLCDDELPSVCGLIKPRPDWMNCNKVCILATSSLSFICLLPVKFLCCLTFVFHMLAACQIFVLFNL